jgi:hypothetical protein
MTRKKDPYRCWFFINQNRRDKSLSPDEQAAASTFASFLSDKDYGEGISAFRFDIYVERLVNFGRHRDVVQMGCAQLSANVDYSAFIDADSHYRHKLLVNAALVLSKYLAEKVALPKTFDANGLVNDFTSYLKTNSLLLPDEELKELVTKPFDTMKFNFLISTAVEVEDIDIHYDLMKIKDYLNNALSGKTFGESVKQFDFGYEIYDFQGHITPHKETADLRRYGTKHRNLLVVKQFDYRQLKGKTHKEQFEILKGKILEAIDDTDKLNKRPKNFDKKKFYITVEKILNEYELRFCS